MKLVRLGVVFFTTVLLIGIGGKTMEAPVVLADGGVKIDEKNFPDAIFREYVKEFDTRVQDGVLDQEELNAVSNITCDAMSIKSMKGIEFFPNLQALDCAFNKLKSLDVSANAELTYLRCDNNELSGLDVSKNTKLIFISCLNNQITSLDVSSNTVLRDFRCSFNSLSSLDVSKNTALITLECSDNRITSLDVSKNIYLRGLSCQENLIASLDVTNNTSLTNLICYSNQIPKLDVSKCTDLQTLSCGSNQLTSLNVENLPDLQYFYCATNKLTSLDVSKNQELLIFVCAENKISGLDVSHCPKLMHFLCYNNRLTSLDLSANTKLVQVACNLNYMQTQPVVPSTCVLSFEPQRLVNPVVFVKAEPVSSSSIRLSWEPVSGAAGYQVWRSTSATGTFISLGTVEVNEKLSVGLTGETKYYYKVRAYKQLTKEKDWGDFSPIVSAETFLVKPSGVKAVTASVTSIEVSWNAVTGAAGYQVWRSTQKDSGFIALGSVETTSRVSTGLTTGTTYYYKVRAYKMVDGKRVYGDYSAVVSAVPKPAAPSNVKAVPETTTGIKISWSKVSGATGYQVWRATSATGAFTAIGSVTETSRVSTGLKAGTTYYYKVRAYKEVNGSKVYGAYSSVVSSMPKPAAPSNMKATVSSATKVTVSWNAVAGATGYEVYRATSANGTYSKLGTVTTTSRACPGLKTGTEYYFKVRAYVEVNGTKYYSAFGAVVSAVPKA